MEFKVTTISGAAGGSDRKAIVNLRVNCESDTVEAVRRLVGAAPDLLAALDGVLWAIESQHFEDIGYALNAGEIRAAIAKARGE